MSVRESSGHFGKLFRALKGIWWDPRFCGFKRKVIWSLRKVCYRFEASDLGLPSQCQRFVWKMTRLNSKQRIYVQVLSSHVWMWNIFFWETNLNKIIEKKQFPNIFWLSLRFPNLSPNGSVKQLRLLDPGVSEERIVSLLVRKRFGGCTLKLKILGNRNIRNPETPVGSSTTTLVFFVTKSTSWWWLIPVLFGFLVLTIWKYMRMVLCHENAKSVVQTFPLMDQLF